MTSTIPSPGAAEDLDFVSEDLGATEDFLVRSYTKMAIEGDGEQRSTRIARRWLGAISFDELEFSYHMSYDADPLGRICLCRVHSGRIEEDFIGQPQDVFAPGDVTLYSPPELPYSGRICQASYDLTMFGTALLDRVATPQSGSAGESVRLLHHRPVSAEAQRQLNAAIDHVRTMVQTEHARSSPLVASTTASLLAAVVVSTFPTNAALEPDGTDRSDAKPTLLRRAISFIEASAHSDISLIDIARAAGVTPRAVQYAFRQHMDMSPMDYLRRVRMDHAHRQLLNADPATTSVHAVAAQWGFAHPGRFSAAYRKAYGRNPSEALKS